ncbi:3-isopropylmalate dehydratase small subunit [Gluconacetobacter diazotrophicus]|uniref:3-isopropylmalate dehydratase small subunit n=1 Tax=Gluconacetobacter diazotrophicus TaxID=33996 RepID=A0A7W4I767_GLUDI|nr:3-isopropylmalate dehydratase small subunit [Gluconacetobacter diazotrophicus]MBB2157538.1 3-isopropylmalate dehydratase small subunit [Gluconacetobacter diazotrophicus]
MEKFVSVTGVACPIPAANVDTDVIMPKQFLKGIDRSGLAQGLFHDLRFDERGNARKDFILNKPATHDSRFLVVGPNFGCGSSREHAVWGMLQYGIRAIIGTSFAGIFADNAANNGLLLVTLSVSEIAALFDAVGSMGREILVDLEVQVINAGDLSIAFSVDADRRAALLDGLDRIGSTLRQADSIRSFEAEYLKASPWLCDRIDA